MKYLIGLGALVLVVVGYFLLVPTGDQTTQAPAPDVASPDTVPTAPPLVAPEAIIPDEAAPTAPDEEALLEEMAAAVRESLPEAVTQTLTLNDALFLPRMRIMEFSYVTSAADGSAAARDMRALIEARSETICREGREMFGMGVTLRNSFEDRAGNLFQRVYLLPEDCQRYY